MKKWIPVFVVLALLTVAGLAGAAGTFLYDPPAETFSYDPPPEQYTFNGCIDPGSYTSTQGDVLDIGQRCQDFTRTVDPAPRDVTYDPAPRNVTCPDSVCPPPPPPTSTACADGLDNDSDAVVDLNDPGCVDAADTDETDPAGTVLSGKDWEDGLITSQGWGKQDGNSLCPPPGDPNNCVIGSVKRGIISVDSTSADRGTKSGKFVLPVYTANRTSAEILYPRNPNRGTDEFYAQALKFDNYAWEGMSFAQYNYQGINGSPIHIAGTQYNSTVTPESNRAEDKAHTSIFLLSDGGNVDTNGGVPPFYSGQPRGGPNPYVGGYSCRGFPAGKCGPYYYFEPGTLDTGTWYEIITHIYWTAGTDGVLEGWARKKGDPFFIKKFSVSGGFPTLQWGAGWSFPTNDVSTTNDKVGAYRQASATQLNVGQDSFCRATTFAAARTCLP